MLTLSALCQDLKIEWGSKSYVKNRNARAVRNFVDYKGNLIFLRASRKSVVIDYYDKEKLKLKKSKSIKKFKANDWGRKVKLVFQTSLIIDNGIIVFATEKPNRRDFGGGLKYQTWVFKLDLNTGETSEWKKLVNVYWGKDFENSDDYSDKNFINDGIVYYDDMSKNIVVYDFVNESFYVYDNNLDKVDKYSTFLNSYIKPNSKPQSIVVSDNGSKWIVFLSHDLQNKNSKKYYYILYRFSCLNDTARVDKQVKINIPESLDNIDAYIENALSFFRIYEGCCVINYGLFNKNLRNVGSYFIKVDIENGDILNVIKTPFDSSMLKAIKGLDLASSELRGFRYFTFNGIGSYTLTNPFSRTIHSQMSGSKGYFIPRQIVGNHRNVGLRLEYFKRDIQQGVSTYSTYSNVSAATGGTGSSVKSSNYTILTNIHGPIMSVDYDTSGKLLSAYVLSMNQNNMYLRGVNDIFNGHIPFSRGNNQYYLFNGKKDCFDFKCWETFKGGIGSLIKNSYFGYHMVDSAGKITSKKVVNLKKELRCIPITSTYYSSGNDIYLLATSYFWSRRYRLIKVSYKE